MNKYEVKPYANAPMKLIQILQSSTRSSIKNPNMLINTAPIGCGNPTANILLTYVIRFEVCVTLTTYDDGLCSILEPHVCNTKRRIEVLEKMQEKGIPTIVWLAPILPYINDSEENIRTILSECARVGVKGVICFGMGLTLRDGDREYYYAALDKHFPGLKERYIRQYGNAYEIPSPKSKELYDVFYDICKSSGMMSDPEECFRYISEMPEKEVQLCIFDQGTI